MGGIVVFEGVSFNKALCSKMTQKEFIDAHRETFFTDRPKPERERLLTDAFQIIKGSITDISL
ncbi:MAG: hypothetical protein PUB21_07905 [Bacteroidales bacterium]|nr:hypothetical protein [Bacteroidales bacterium]